MRLVNKLPIFLCLAFVTVIALPMVVSILETDKEASKIEKRNLQKWPIFSESESLRDYFSTINNYVNDHFGFREDLIEVNNIIKFSLNESPVKRVVRGKDDWLFYKILDPLLSTHQFTKEHIKNNLKVRADSLKQRHSELTKQGIVYQHIVAPNKMNLYSEHLPSVYSLTDVNAAYDFFKEQLLDTDKTIAFDAIDVLRDAKDNDLNLNLYFKNDTHWNPYGAYLVIQETVKQLKQLHPTLDLDIKDHSFKAESKKSGDLADFIGLSSKLSSIEPITQYAECTNRSNIKVVKRKFSTLSCETNNTSLLIIGDSFMTAVYPYLGEAVGTLYMTNIKTSRSEIKTFIDEVKPDVVIDVIIERSLARPMN